MREMMRLITTLFIWGMAGGIMIAAMVSSNVESGNIVPLVLFLSVAAAISTGAVWFSGQPATGQTDAQRGKMKRIQSLRDSRRVERLIADLDDEEIYDLEALLLARENPAGRSQRDL